MKVIRSTSGYFAVKPVDTLLLLLPVGREFNLTGEILLLSGELFFVLPESIKRFVLFTAGKSNEPGNTHIQTNRFF